MKQKTTITRTRLSADVPWYVASPLVREDPAAVKFQEYFNYFVANNLASMTIDSPTDLELVITIMLNDVDAVMAYATDLDLSNIGTVFCTEAETAYNTENGITVTGTIEDIA